MPSEPQPHGRPTLEELSAYVDQELDADAHARVDEHLADCAECRARVSALRDTVNAVRALPMETPPRTFTVPERRRAWSWAPAGWIGGAAAALLLIVFTASHLPLQAKPSGSTGLQYSASQAPRTPPVAGGLGSSGQNLDASVAQTLSRSVNQVTVVDPRNSARRMTVGTDQAAYSGNGQMLVGGALSGDRSTQIRLVLRRGSYGVQLASPTVSASNSGSMTFQGAYSISGLPLGDPRAGSYTLTVTWTAADGSTLIADLPVAISG